MAGRRGPQRFTWPQMIRDFVEAKEAASEFNSPATVRIYTLTIEALAEDCGNIDPRYVERDDIVHTLLRWPRRNTKSVRRAQLVSFFDWMVEEGWREYNPARQTKHIRRRKPPVIRWTLEETRRFLAAAQTTREKRIAYLGVIQGLRLAELLALKGEDFARPGWVRVHGKGDANEGGKVRELPLLPDALPVAEEIRQNVAPEHYVIPAERWRDPNVVPREKKQLLDRPGSRGAVRGVVETLCVRAGLSRATPHVMRRAFADFIQGAAMNLQLTQEMLGHSNPGTTATYLSGMSPEALAAAVQNLSIRPIEGVALPIVAVEEVGKE